MLRPAVKLPLRVDEKLEAQQADTFPFPKHYHMINCADTQLVALSLSGEKGEPLYCERCETIKPERTHHCKECDRCAPKMDHHCIWINGCVDESNYKYFFMFVFYVAAYALWVEINVIPLLFKNIAQQNGGSITWAICWRAYKIYLACIYYFWKNIAFMIINRKWIPILTGLQNSGFGGITFHWYSVAALGLLFGLTLLGFTAVHFYYIIKNQTSIEHITSRPTYIRADFDKTGHNYEVIFVEQVSTMYHLGYYKNWCSVMGSNPFICLLPFASLLTSNTTNLLTKIYPYNDQFTKKITEAAQIQRERRLRET
ncbi:DHHC palmitoyltransferase-domain-containing protein [Parasitella parasitica]|nr:DHHC palmitoyltransferase-domain-containing protein [Parasitella parasitica]